MKRNIILCSHGRLCEGMLDTMELFSLKDENTYAIPFYVDGRDSEKELKTLVESFKQDDITFLITDIAFGSVNQIVTKLFMARKGCYIISGMNLALIMALSTIDSNNINEDIVREQIQSVQNSIVYVPDLFISTSEEDE